MATTMKVLTDTGLTTLKNWLKSTFVSTESGKGLSTNDYTTAEKEKLAGIAANATKNTIDSALSETSTNAVQNKVVNTALSKKQDALTAGDNITITYGTISAKDTTYSAATTSAAGLMSASDKAKLDGVSAKAEANVIETVQLNGTALTVTDETVNIPAASTSAYGATKLSDSVSTSDSATAATSTAVKMAYDLANSKQSPATTLAGYGIENAYTKSEVDTIVKNLESGISSVSSVYKPQGSVTFANLPTPSADNLGYVYNVTDAFTTTASFKEGAGIEYGAGTNVAIIEDDGNYLFDAMSGAVDLSAYVTSDSLHELTAAEVTTILEA